MRTVNGELHRHIPESNVSGITRGVKMNLFKVQNGVTGTGSQDSLSSRDIASAAIPFAAGRPMDGVGYTGGMGAKSLFLRISLR